MDYQYSQYSDEQKHHRDKTTWNAIIKIIVVVIVIFLIIFLAKYFFMPAQEVNLTGGVLSPSEIRLTAISALENF